MNIDLPSYSTAAIVILLVILGLFAAGKIVAWWLNSVHVWHGCPHCRRHWYVDLTWQGRYWSWLGQPKKWDEQPCGPCAKEPAKADVAPATEAPVVLPPLAGGFRGSSATLGNPDPAFPLTRPAPCLPADRGTLSLTGDPVFSASEFEGEHTPPAGEFRMWSG